MSLTSSDIINQDISGIVISNASANETRLSPLFDTQEPEDIDSYTASTDKIMKDVSSSSISQPKTFTIQNIKQVVKEIDIKPPVVKKDKIKSVDSSKLNNLENKTAVTIKDDDSLEKAKNIARNKVLIQISNMRNSLLKNATISPNGSSLLFKNDKFTTGSNKLLPLSTNTNNEIITNSNKSSNSLSDKIIPNQYANNTSSSNPITDEQLTIGGNNKKSPFELTKKIIPNRYSTASKKDGAISNNDVFKSDKQISDSLKTKTKIASKKYKLEESMTPSFSLEGKTINKIIHPDGTSDDDIDGLLPASPSISTFSNCPSITRDMIPDAVGRDQYNKIRKAYDTVKDLTECMDWDDALGFDKSVKDGSDVFSALNDLLNTSINYDLGKLVRCLEPVAKLLNIKSVNKVIDKVGSHGSVSVFEAITSGGNKDKLLDAFHKSRKTFTKSSNNFTDPVVQESTITAINNLGIDKKDYYAASYDDGHSTEETTNGNIDVFSLSSIKNDVQASKDFVNLSIGSATTNLLNAVPTF